MSRICLLLLKLNILAWQEFALEAGAGTVCLAWEQAWDRLKQGTVAPQLQTDEISCRVDRWMSVQPRPRLSETIDAFIACRHHCLSCASCSSRKRRSNEMMGTLSLRIGLFVVNFYVSS